MRAHSPPDIGEILELDLLCLRGADGAPLDADIHRQALSASLDRAEWAIVRRDGRLAAYLYIWRDGPSWFVGGLCLHPEHRNAAVMRALAEQFRILMAREQVDLLRSHVRKANAPSMRLHRRLGFSVELESADAVAFAIQAAKLLDSLPE